MEDFPKNVCVKILSFLDANSLKSASLVSTKWREAAFSSELMKNFKLLILNYGIQKSFIQKYGSKFSSVKIDSSVVDGNRMPNYNYKQVSEMFQAIKYVKELEISNIKLSFRVNVRAMNDLPELKKLHLEGTAISYKISNFLQNVKLEQIILVERKQSRKFFDTDFMAWLVAQTKLKHLVLEENACFIFSNFRFIRQTFRLQNLIINGPEVKDFWNTATVLNFQEFIAAQGVIESVVLLIKPNYLTDLNVLTQFNSILLNLSKKSHKINVYVDNKTTLRLLPSFPLVESLEFYSSNLESTEIFYCRNCKILKVFASWSAYSYLSNNIIPNHTRFSNLKELKLVRHYDFRKGENFLNMKFGNLRVLDLTYYLASADDWKLIIDKCPLIEKLSLNIFILTTEIVKLMCLKWKRFESLQLGYGLYEADIVKPLIDQVNFKTIYINAAMKSHFETILENAADLKVEVVEVENTNVLSEMSISMFFQRQEILKKQMRLLENRDNRGD